jgi:hypothetical protein
VKRWLARAQERTRWLGGEATLEGAVHDHVAAFVMDTMLSTAVGTIEPTPDRIAELADEYVADYLAPLVDDKDVEAESARQDTLRRALADDLAGRQSWHARLLQGSTGRETRRYLQAAFNRRGASPGVLIAQSQVGREGLNLHKACRVVLQFHAEWNPAILEQQIGRVDRKGSHWEDLARRWLDGGADGTPSFIEIRQLVFEGTYDAYKWDRRPAPARVRRQLVRRTAAARGVGKGPIRPSRDAGRRGALVRTADGSSGGAKVTHRDPRSRHLAADRRPWPPTPGKSKGPRPDMTTYGFPLSRSCKVAIKIGSAIRSFGRPAFAFTAISVGRWSTRSWSPSSITHRVCASNSS